MSTAINDGCIYGCAPSSRFWSSIGNGGPPATQKPAVKPASPNFFLGATLECGCAAPRASGEWSCMVSSHLLTQQMHSCLFMVIIVPTMHRSWHLRPLCGHPGYPHCVDSSSARSSLQHEQRGDRRLRQGFGGLVFEYDSLKFNISCFSLGMSILSVVSSFRYSVRPRVYFSSLLVVVGVLHHVRSWAE